MYHQFQPAECGRDGRYWAEKTRNPLAGSGVGKAYCGQWREDRDYKIIDTGQWEGQNDPLDVYKIIIYRWFLGNKKWSKNGIPIPLTYNFMEKYYNEYHRDHQNIIKPTQTAHGNWIVENGWLPKDGHFDKLIKDYLIWRQFLAQRVYGKVNDMLNEKTLMSYLEGFVKEQLPGFFDQNQQKIRNDLEALDKRKGKSKQGKSKQ